MGRIVLIAVIAVTVIHCYGALQVQMPEHAELQQPENDLQAQIRELQKNVTDIWTYIQDLRSAVSQHLIHLRQHQVELESSMHKMEHLHDATSDSHSHGDLHGDSHHHSGEQHSHGDSHDSHSHDSDSHSHGSDSHSHGSDSHSHGSDSHSHGSESHSHSGEHHSHSGEHHSHSGEQHSHSGEHGHYSHSHSSHDHSKEDGSHSHDHGSTSSSSHSHSHDDHSHGSDHSHDHKDSHETEDLEQGIQKVATDVGPVIAEPVIAPTTRQEHYHHHHHGHSQGSRSSSGSSSNAMDLMNENTFHHHHHHHDSVSRSSRNRTVELPKYSDYDMYDFGVCNVQPNQAIPEDQRQNIQGQVTLWQKKTGGPLNIYVRLQGFQMGDHHGHHGAHQAVQQEQDNETPLEEVVHKHGFHIHALGDLSNGCQSTGPHFNPKSVNHGGPTSLVRHVGDLGNIECDSNGVANIVFSDDMASLRGQYSIIGKAMVVHAKPDDFGQGGDAESLKTGNAGTRLACCVIQQVNKLPIRYYKAMKTASQYQNY